MAGSTSTPAGMASARRSTRPESFESKGKRGAGSGPARGPNAAAQARAAVYGNPLPLYVANNETLALVYSLAWTLSRTCQTIVASMQQKEHSRNRIADSAYLPEKMQGYWDEATRSVWVLPTRRKKRRRKPLSSGGNEQAAETGNTLTQHSQDHETTAWMDWLWKRGFFGKGSLSRSEPTWWQREKNRVTGEHVPTAEDITSARRAERKIVKKQKAQERADEKEKQVAALSERRRIESQAAVKKTSSSEDGDSSEKKREALQEAVQDATESALLEVADPNDVEALSAKAVQEVAQSVPTTVDSEQAAKWVLLASNGSADAAAEQPSTSTSTAVAATVKPNRLPNAAKAALKQETKMAELDIHVPNLEHTQLQREEAFFLVLCLDSLEVLYRPLEHNSTEHYNFYQLPESQEELPLDVHALWRLFAESSFSAALRAEARLSSSSTALHIKPDNPFILSYVVYHHYRSLGWVVRNGIKFCVDWVLYKGADGTSNMRGGAGPVGGHAEFAVAIIPSYEDPSDAPTLAALNHRRDWRWLNTVNRVCSGVKKTVILAYVTIPPLSSQKRDADGNLTEWQTPGCLKHYKIKEVSVRRFIPTRSRD